MEIVPNKIDKALIKRQIGRASRIPLRQLRCRVGGDRHHWHRVQPDWEPSNKALAVASQCSRCLTIKRMDVDPSYGIIIGNPSYQYPDGFLSKRENDEVAMSPRAVRAVMSAAYKGALPSIVPQE